MLDVASADLPQAVKAEAEQLEHYAASAPAQALVPLPLHQMALPSLLPKTTMMPLPATLLSQPASASALASVPATTVTVAPATTVTVQVLALLPRVAYLLQAVELLASLPAAQPALAIVYLLPTVVQAALLVSQLLLVSSASHLLQVLAQLVALRMLPTFLQQQALTLESQAL